MRKALFILGSLSDLDVEWLIENGHKKEVPQGTTLIQQGTEIDSLYIITQGEFQIVNPQLGNKEIARLKAGEIVGEMSFIDSSPPSASVIASQPSVVLAISRRKLENKLDEDKGFASRFYFAIAVFLSDRLRKTVSNYGYGDPSEEDAADEIDFNVMENLHMAGARFDTIMRKLSEI